MQSFSVADSHSLESDWCGNVSVCLKWLISQFLSVCPVPTHGLLFRCLIWLEILFNWNHLWSNLRTCKFGHPIRALNHLFSLNWLLYKAWPCSCINCASLVLVFMTSVHSGFVQLISAWFPLPCTPCLKNSQNCFFHNFVKFFPTSIISGTKMAKTIQLCQVDLFSTSPNLC